MNCKFLAVIALLVEAVVCQGWVVADDSCPSWLLPRVDLENLLRKSPTGLFPDFYAAPVFPFVIEPAEQTVRVELKEMTASEAQLILDNAFEESPSAVFLVHVTGAISVSSVPLSVHDRTCMFLENDAQFVATAGCTADSLLSVLDGEYVSITGSYDPRERDFSEQKYMFSGNGVVRSGIRIEKSGRVHLDRISVTRCKDAGISITGRGPEQYDHAVSLTRSKVCGSKN